MADKEISSLDPITALDDDTLFVVSQQGTAKKATAKIIKPYMGGGSGSEIPPSFHNLKGADGQGGGYTIPIMSETVLGGGKAVPKTADMTEAVGVDETGKLWSKPGAGSSSGSSLYIIQDVSLDDTSGTLSQRDLTTVKNALANGQPLFAKVNGSVIPASLFNVHPSVLCWLITPPIPLSQDNTLNVLRYAVTLSDGSFERVTIELGTA